MPVIEKEFDSQQSDSSAQTHRHFPHLLSIDGKLLGDLFRPKARQNNTYW